MKLKVSEFQERLFYRLEHGSVLVFPSDNDKREFLYSYVEAKNKAVSADRVLSYDEFRSLFIPYNSKREIEYFEKVRFVLSLLDSINDELQSFYNPEFNEGRNPFANDIAGKLSDIKALVEDKNVFLALSPSLQKDISFLYQNYINFLNRNDLRDPHYDEIDKSLLDADAREFLLLVPYLNPYYKNDKKLFESRTNINEERFDDVALPQIKKYDNVDEEIRGTLRSIKNLLENGESCSNIRVTLLGSDEKAKSEFVRLSYLYDVPLEVDKAYSLESDSEYLFFKSAKAIVEKGAHLSDVESLLTNTLLNFKENASELYFYFVNNAFEKIDTASIQNTEYRQFTESLFSTLGAVVGAKDSKTFIVGLQNFSSLFLRCASDGDIFTHSKGIAKDIDLYVDEKKENSSFFDRFMLLFENSVSSRREDVFSSISLLKNEGNGIKVDDYDLFKVAVVPYHFMLFATADNAKREIKQYTSISDFEKEKLSLLHAMEEMNFTKDIAEDLFLLNSGLSCHLIVSYSESNYTGFALSPAFFDAEETAVREETYISLKSKDSDYAENDLYQNSMNFNKNDISYNSAVLYNNTPKHLSDSIFVEYSKEKYAISPTTLKQIDDCPFAWCLKSFIDDRINPEEEKRLLKSPPYDKEGAFYHAVIEAFYKREENETEIFDEKELLSHVYDEVLSSYPYSSYFSKRMEAFLKTYCKKMFLRILDNENFLDLTYKDSEVKLEKEVDGVHLKGRLDGLFVEPTGDIVIVDYKRSSYSIPKKSGFNIEKFNEVKEKKLPSYQAPFYIMLYEEVEKNDAKKFIYYSFLDGKSLSFPLKEYRGFEYLTNEEQIAITKEAIKRTDSYIKKGVFEATGRECKDCGFKSMCRVRFI